MEPLFSIITVCRNAAEPLELSMRSLISQQFKDFEYIVIDGASTDQTSEIIKKYENAIAVFVSAAALFIDVYPHELTPKSVRKVFAARSAAKPRYQQARQNRKKRAPLDQHVNQLLLILSTRIG